MEAEWALCMALRMAFLEKADPGPLIEAILKRSSDSPAAEEARRMRSALEVGKPPYLCSSMKSPRRYTVCRDFQRSGFVLATGMPEGRKLDSVSWTDGLGLWVWSDEWKRGPAVVRSLVWPGYAFRPGLCYADFYEGETFVARRLFTVSGWMLNEDAR